jgi:phenylalanyl-tRNA synthetase beta chain
VRVSYEWLKEFVDFDLGYEDLISELTLVGLEADPAPEPEFNFEKVVAAKIIKCEEVSGGFQLQVDTSGETVPIYCTAPGLEVGQLIALALVGGRVGAKVIEPAEFDGNKSHGMACSEAELGLGFHATSLMFLDENEIKAGDDIAEYLSAYRGIEIELTANRTDCWSFLGVAREIGAICGTTVKPLPMKEGLEIVDAKDANIEIAIADPELSKAYSGLFFPEIDVKPSPLPVIRKLISIGLRPINNIVDITNIVLYETGQPSHAFDYSLIKDKYIEVRPARPGEKITTLDDVERDLIPTDLVIADGSGPVALAGVMGGFSSEITFDTKQMFLENAHFDPPTIRRTSRRTGLRTDASIRFERGIDPVGLRRSAKRIAWWVEHLGCGKVDDHMVEVSHLTDEKKVVALRTDRMEKVLGYKVEESRVDEILNGLGFEIEQGDGVRNVTVPPYRLDVGIEEDLIEEVARHFRYDNFPDDLPVSHMKPAAYNRDFAAARHFKNVLSGLGLWEVGTYATGKDGFIDMENPLKPDSKSITFINPLTEDHARLRTHLVPSFLGVIQHNLRHGVEPKDVFEIAAVYNDAGGTGFERYEQGRQVGILALSRRGKGKKRLELEEKGYLHIKGLAERFIDQIGGEVSGYELLDETDVYPFKVAIKGEGDDWGMIGSISESLLDELDIPQAAYFVLLSFGMSRDVYEAGLKRMKYQSLARFPAITRDLALVVKEGIQYADIEASVKANGGELLREVGLFDVFRSDKIGAGQKQFAVSLRYSHPERTLTDEEVNESIDAILKAAEKEFDAKLRDW